MSKPVLIDLFSSAGGCARGYQMAGFHVIGVDNRPQPRYAGDEFYQMDAMEFVKEYRGEVSAYSASPPCQGYSNTRHLQGNAHPMLIEEVRRLLVATGKPYVIENVKGAPLINPIVLVGSMFGLLTMRPRFFESNVPLPFMLAPPAAAKHAKMGRPPQSGEYIHVVGHFSDVAYASKAMGIEWMTQSELAQAVPPSYTNWIGERLLEGLEP